MKRINVLADEIASQIAAGEVIERPASVVKELVENAIDAGSTQISVRIEEAGKKLIEVVDNGSGIPYEELQIAVMRHATSKLRTAADLFHIQTLGFRGEALASIASVSVFKIASKESSALTGGALESNDGKNFRMSPFGGSNGTTVSVRNLFFNVPARLKFLKSDLTEKQKISSFMIKQAFAFPHIRFQLFNEGELIFHSTGSGDRREILGQVYGFEIAKNMLDLKMVEGNYQITGYISPVSITRSNRKGISFFINGRWIKETQLVSAVLKAYHTMIMVGRYPMAFLFLDIPYQEVDVNVHPTKAEVRFSNPNIVFSLVQRAVRRALLAYPIVPEIKSPFWKDKTQDQVSQPTQWLAGEKNFETQTEDNPPSDSEEVESTSNLPQQAPLTSNLPILKHIGQLGGTYIIAEGPDGLYLIDQHAAHERILFERLMRQLQDTVVIQPLLAPEILHLPANQAMLLHEKLPLLNKIGFDIAEFGQNTYQIRGVPAILVGMNPSDAIHVAIGDFEDDERPLAGIQEAILAARVCKRAAVKGGQVLTREEQRVLIENLEKCQSPRTCPHGRPTMIYLSVELLEKQFGRKGSL